MISSRLRGLLVAIVPVALAAGLVAVVAAHDGGAGLANASDHAGKVVPVRGGNEDADEDAGEDAGEEAEQEAGEEAAGGGEHCATDPRTLEGEALAALNHGAIVCWAAHQDTPEGYRNHGAWVSEWAKQKGSDSSATARAGHGKSDGAGKPDGVGKR